MAADGHQVLVVDDEPDVCWALQTLLTNHRFAVVAVGSGTEALLWFDRRQEACDLVLVDAKLPDMDGFELAQRIRAADGCRAPVVMVSGYFYKDDLLVQNALHSGLIAGFVTKPFRHDEMLEVIHGVLSLGDRDPTRERAPGC